MKENLLYCVVYRTGGTENFKWNHSSAMTKDEVIESLESTRKMGYKCFIQDYSRILAIGLPETFDVGQQIKD